MAVFVLLIAASVVPIGAAIGIGAYRHDDAYITLTFSKNLASGAGFVYNGGPPVLGTTTPLFALLIAGLSWLIPNVSLLAIATGVGVVAWIATAWVLMILWRRIENNLMGCAVLGVVLLTQVQNAPLLGTEATLFQFLLTATIYLYLSNSFGWAGMSLGLLILTRGEGILLGLIMLIAALVTKKQAWHKFILTLGVVLFIWGAYSFLTFGSLLPSTLGAKIVQRESGLWRGFGEGLINEWLLAWGNSSPLFIVLGVFMLIGLGYSIWLRREWLLFALWGVSYIVGYLIINPASYWWYASPIHFIINLFAALGMAAIPILFVRIAGRQGLHSAWLNFATFLIAMFIAISNVQNMKQSLAVYFTGNNPSSAGLYHAGYLPAAQWFVAHSQPGETIAYVEVGYLGYYTRNRFIDLTGLLMPAIAEHVKTRDLTWGFLEYGPDYVIIVPEFDWLMLGVRQLPEFKQNYRQVYEATRLNREPLQIYARRDSSYRLSLGGE